MTCFGQWSEADVTTPGLSLGLPGPRGSCQCQGPEEGLAASQAPFLTRGKMVKVMGSLATDGLLHNPLF